MKAKITAAVALSLLTVTAFVPTASAQEVEGDPAVCAEGAANSLAGTGPVYYASWNVGPNEDTTSVECWEESNGCEDLQRTEAEANEAGCEDPDTLVFGITVGNPA